MRPLTVFLALALAGPVALPARAAPVTILARHPGGWEWRADGDQQQLGLYRWGRQVGTWHVLGGYYRALSWDARAGTWAWSERQAQPPAPLPTLNFGVGRLRLDGHLGRTHYSVAGHEVGRAEALARIAATGPGVRSALAGGKVPDLAGKRRLVVIGQGREAVLKDLAEHPALARWRDSVIAQGYDAGHWHIAGMGYVSAGKPTIYLLAPDGSVLHRQDDYEGGALALAKALTAQPAPQPQKLRQPAPDYDPQRDVDCRRPAAPLLARGKLPWSVWAVLGTGLVGWLALRRRTS